MYRIGYAEDIHRLIKGRKLILGGIEIPCEFGEDAHSDGDVLIHALSEALLGALALGDLGTYFPDDGPETLNMDSKLILEKCYSLIKKEGYVIFNLDCSIILEKPKLSSFIQPIRKSLSAILDIELNQISIKARTNEKLGPIGEGKAIKAIAVVLVKKAS